MPNLNVNFLVGNGHVNVNNGRGYMNPLYGGSMFDCGFGGYGGYDLDYSMMDGGCFGGPNPFMMGGCGPRFMEMGCGCRPFGYGRGYEYGPVPFGRGCSPNDSTIDKIATGLFGAAQIGWGISNLNSAF